MEAEVKALRARGVVFEEYDQPGLKTVNGINDHPKARTVVQGQRRNILAISQRM